MTAPIEIPAMVLPEGAYRTESSNDYRAAWRNDGLRWAPFDQSLDLDDQCVTVTLCGREPEQFWAKADGPSMSQQRRHAQWFALDCGYGKSDKRRTARRARYFQPPTGARRGSRTSCRWLPFSHSVVALFVMRALLAPYRRTQ